MSGPITQVPKGLLGLLGAKLFGQSPNELSDVISGTLDLRANYRANNYQYFGDFVAAVVLGGSNTQLFPTAGNTITPNGKIRFPLAFGFGITSPAASAITVTPVLVYNGASGRSVPIAAPVVVGASANPWHGFNVDPDLVLLPGMGFGYQVGALTGAAVQLACMYLFAEFDLGA